MGGDGAGGGKVFADVAVAVVGWIVDRGLGMRDSDRRPATPPAACRVVLRSVPQRRVFFRVRVGETPALLE